MIRLRWGETDIQSQAYPEGMQNRRQMMQLAVALMAASPSAHGDAVVKKLAEQALPDGTYKNWQVNALEVSYKPGEESHAHQHAGFVVGYVLEGEIRFGLKDQPERVLKAGEIFYEPPGAVHQVSGNASKTKPARLLALIFADKGATLSKPA
jgi:quercetin dioxygenase-like cupin family protein